MTKGAHTVIPLQRPEVRTKAAPIFTMPIIHHQQPHSPCLFVRQPQHPHSHPFFIMDNTYKASLFPYKTTSSCPFSFSYPNHQHVPSNNPRKNIKPHPPKTQTPSSHPPRSLARHVLPHNLHLRLLPPPQEILDLLPRRRDAERPP